jgi:hypothetical protein
VNRVTLAAAAICAVSLAMRPQVGAAQIVVEPTPLRSSPREMSIAQGCKEDPLPKEFENAVALLDAAYHGGESVRARSVARAILDAAKCAAIASKAAREAEAYDYRVAPVWVTWIGTDAMGSHGLHRIRVQAQEAARPFTLDLPGVRMLHEIFVSSDNSAELVSVFASTEQADPVLEEIPSAVGRVLPALFGAMAAPLGSVTRTPLIEGRPAAKVWYVMPYAVSLPNSRAKLVVTSIAREPVPLDEFETRARAFAAEVGFQTSRCARRLASSQADALVASSQVPACKAPSLSGAALEGARIACLAAFDSALRNAFEAEARDPSCATETDTKALASVDAASRKFVGTNLGREVKAEVTVENVPPRYVSFGVMAGVAIGAKLQDERVKLGDDGRLQADPLPRLLTIITVNASFRGYDPASVTMTKQERWRWFAGAVIVPDFGVASGLSFLAVRGVALNAGVAVLFVKKPSSGSLVGEPPATASDPFRLGTAVASFVGVGYSF